MEARRCLDGEFSRPRAHGRLPEEVLVVADEEEEEDEEDEEILLSLSVLLETVVLSLED